MATCFTLTVPDPQGFALACQLDKGLAPDIDYMALRRAEDVAACAAIGAAPRHLPFPEAPHRGYASAPALFAGVRADDTIAARTYASQLGFQFGGAAAMDARLGGIWSERFRVAISAGPPFA